MFLRPVCLSMSYKPLLLSRLILLLSSIPVVLQRRRNRFLQPFCILNPPICHHSTWGVVALLVIPFGVEFNMTDFILLPRLASLVFDIGHLKISACSFFKVMNPCVASLSKADIAIGKKRNIPSFISVEVESQTNL